MTPLREEMQNILCEVSNTISEVLKAARKTPKRKGQPNVLIADVFATMGLSRRHLPAFKEALLDAYKERDIELAKVDMPQGIPRDVLADSLVVYDNGLTQLELQAIQL